MEHGTISSWPWPRALASLLIWAVVMVLFPSLASADNGSSNNWWPDNNKKQGPSVQVTVVSRPDGVYVEISVKERYSGSSSSSSPSQATPQPINPTPPPAKQPASSNGGNPGGSTPAPKSWSDDTGYYEQTPDGHTYYLTIPDLSSAIDWKQQFAQNPNKIPFALYVDNQFQGIVWIPNSSQSSNIQIGTPPPQVSLPPPPPSGDGSSTNPQQVALSLLDRVPLPNIQIRMNPGLGLVNLPGWFWVEGYDGKPFGTSQTVTVPPVVGPDVPFTQVPESDPRRQPTSFTVSVQVWPTAYQWNFGDGTTLATESLGRAFPAESDIQHTYQYSSLKTQSGFPIQLTVVFAAQYDVNGGASQVLPSISHTYVTSYPVQEAQSLLASR